MEEAVLLSTGSRILAVLLFVPRATLSKEHQSTWWFCKGRTGITTFAMLAFCNSAFLSYWLCLDNLQHCFAFTLFTIFGFDTLSSTKSPASIIPKSSLLEEPDQPGETLEQGLNDLHWLRVPERITYKLFILVYNCLHDTAPRYLQDVIQPVAEVTSRRRLRSASSSVLVVPATRCSSLGDRAFAVAGPCAWNSLPAFVTDCWSPLTFKKYLKTYLFSLSF